MEGIVRRGLRFIVLIEKTWKSNHMQMKLQRQDFLLSYFKTLSDGPSGVKLTTSRMTAQYTQLTEPLVRSIFAFNENYDNNY